MSDITVRVEMGAIPAAIAAKRAGLYDVIVYEAMVDATEYLAGRLALNTPVGATGKARQAVVTDVSRSAIGSTIEGHVDYAEPASSYIAFADQGTRAHWPPYDPIAYWVMRVLGTSDPKVVGRVRRGIARRGTKAQRFVEGTADAERATVPRVFEMGLNRALSRLGGGGVL